MSSVAPPLAGLLAVILAIVLSTRVVDALMPGARHIVLAGDVDDGDAARHRAGLSRLVAAWRRWRVGTDIGPEPVALWCDALTRSLRAGHSLRHSLLRERPPDALLRDATHSLRHALERGQPVAHAASVLLDDVGARVDVVGPHLRLLGSVLASTAEIGGSAAVPLDRVAAALRLRVVDGQERAAQSAQARLSAHVLTFVPLGVLALLVTTDADVRSVVVQPVGVVLVVLGLALNLTGWWWMRRIIGSGT